MARHLNSLRHRYMGQGLDDGDMASDPLVQLNLWITDASAAGIRLPEAMVLATVGSNGQPSARTVLLKSAHNLAIGFYTNYLSRKGKELASNPNAALVFFWHEINRQVRITGKVQLASPDESDAYFAKRERGAMIEAWASPQSEGIISRDALETRFEAFEQQFEGSPVPRPKHCGLYRFLPDSFEFWQGRLNRMHDRLQYSLNYGGKTWRIRRLAP